MQRDQLLAPGISAWLEYKCLEAVAPAMPGRALAAHMATPVMQPVGSHGGVLATVGRVVAGVRNI